MAAQKAIPMSAIEKLNQKLESEAKSMDQACDQAVAKLKEEFEKKRSELKGRLDKLKTGEQELINNFKQLDTQRQQELTQLATELGVQAPADSPNPPTATPGATSPALSAGTQPPTPGTVANASPDQQTANPTNLTTPQSPTQSPQTGSPDQTLVALFVETNREFDKIIKDYKEKVKSLMAQNAAGAALANANASPGTTGGTNLTQINGFIESREKSLKESTHKLEKIRHKIDKYTKKLEDLEAKETNEMVQAEKKCKNEESEERKSESEKVMKKAKETLDKWEDRLFWQTFDWVRN